MNMLNKHSADLLSVYFDSLFFITTFAIGITILLESITSLVFNHIAWDYILFEERHITNFIE